MRLDPTEHLPAPSDPPVTAHVAGRASAVHDDDAAWMAKMKARENPKPPQDVTGAMFAAAARAKVAAEREHEDAQAAAIQANQRAIKASAAMWEAREQFRRASNGYSATLARKEAAEKAQKAGQPTDQVQKP